MYLTCN